MGYGWRKQVFNIFIDIPHEILYYSQNPNPLSNSPKPEFKLMSVYK